MSPRINFRSAELHRQHNPPRAPARHPPGRTAADNATVRAVFVIGPDKKVGRQFTRVTTVCFEVRWRAAKQYPGGVAQPNWRA